MDDSYRPILFATYPKLVTQLVTPFTVFAEPWTPLWNMCCCPK